MRTLLCGTIALVVSVVAARAQAAGEPNEGSRITYNPAGQVATFSWWGKVGATYFVKFSDDLMTWNYITSSFAGIGNIASMNYTTSASRLFFRLQFTTAPFSADFDADGISNLSEISMGSDPLNPDSNGDGIRDGIALSLGFDPADTDSDGDGLSNAVELLMGTSLLSQDTDGDGIGDAADYLPLDSSASGPGPGVSGPPVILSLTSPPGAVLLPP